MKRYQARVVVRKIPTVADPEGKTIESALRRLGHQGVERVRTGKIFRLEIVAENEEAARRELEEVSRDILSNPVIEEFETEIEEA